MVLLIAIISAWVLSLNTIAHAVQMLIVVVSHHFYAIQMLIVVVSHHFCLGHHSIQTHAVHRDGAGGPLCGTSLIQPNFF